MSDVVTLCLWPASIRHALEEEYTNQGRNSPPIAVQSAIRFIVCNRSFIATGVCLYPPLHYLLLGGDCYDTEHAASE